MRPLRYTSNKCATAVLGFFNNETNCYLENLYLNDKERQEVYCNLFETGYSKTFLVHIFFYLTMVSVILWRRSFWLKDIFKTRTDLGKHWLFTGKSGWKVVEHDVLGLPNRKFPGATEHLKRQSFFCRTENYKRKFVFHFFKAILR